MTVKLATSYAHQRCKRNSMQAMYGTTKQLEQASQATQLAAHYEAASKPGGSKNSEIPATQ
jgi:hypothetical protein